MSDMANYQDLTLPLEPGVQVEITLPRPMSPTQWERMLDILTAMKPGLVKETTPT